MIEVRDLWKSFTDPDGGEIAAVRGASLSCGAGTIYGLLGPNGAGKTTTLRCLATILTPTSGTAVIAGHDLASEPEAVRRSIGFASTTTGLYGRLTPRETFRFFASLHGLKGARQDARVADVLTLLELEPHADRPNDRLSTGLRQRVSLGRAIVHDPPVLILDEPTTGLDPLVSRTVEEALEALAAAGKCILFSTHQIAQAEAICTRLGVLARGRVVAQGTAAELRARAGTESLLGAFFAFVREADDAP